MRPRFLPLGALQLIVVVSCSCAPIRVPDIQLMNDDARSRATGAQLVQLTSRLDLSRWQFTETVIIDSSPGVIPHSHPALTLSTRHIDNDHLLLATYIHEQLHWYVGGVDAKTKAAIDDLRLEYPDVPVGGRDGGRSEYSTYLHLIVNTLEYEALQQLIGEKDARTVIEFWTNDHYRWIYRTVLNDGAKISGLLRNHDIGP